MDIMGKLVVGFVVNGAVKAGVVWGISIDPIWCQKDEVAELQAYP
jgi:hypothetical protein